MKPLPPKPDILAVAAHVVWFEPAERAIADPIRFMAYLLTYGNPGDLREAVENAPPGIFDERSWAYWNTMIDRQPAPPMPRRIIPEKP
jgi:hypothetical protein